MLKIRYAICAAAGILPLISAVSKGAYIYHVSTGSYTAQSTATSKNATIHKQQLIYDPATTVNSFSVAPPDPSNIHLSTSYVVGFTADVSWVGAVMPDPTMSPPVTPLNGFTITGYAEGPDEELGLTANEIQVMGVFEPFESDPTQHPSTPVYLDQNFFTVDFVSPSAGSTPMVTYTTNAVSLTIVDENNPENPVVYGLDSSNTTFLQGTATTIVPEPASLGLFCLGGAFVLTRRRPQRSFLPPIPTSGAAA